MNYAIYRYAQGEMSTPTLVRIERTLKAALRAVDTLDNIYGASIHYYRHEIIQA